MFAVIKTGGKQYLVKEKQRLRIEKCDVAEGGDIVFNEVLMVTDEQGGGLKVGTPHVEGATVSGKVLKQGKAKKVMVVKYKRKTRYLRRRGHRQPFTEVQIESIK